MPAKIFIILFSVLFAVLITLSACNNTDNSSNESVNSPVSDLDKYVAQVTEEKSTPFDSAFVDLNGDGMEDAVVLLKGMNYCGSGGCTLLIFEKMKDKYRLVSRSTVTRTPIKVLDSTEHGWKTLIVRSDGREVIMQFDGKIYPLNPSVEPVATQQQNLKSTALLK